MISLTMTIQVTLISFSDTEIQMLRNTQKEIKRDSNLSGDVFTMKAKLRSLQEQVESGENKISALRNEVLNLHSMKA